MHNLAKNLLTLGFALTMIAQAQADSGTSGSASSSVKEAQSNSPYTTGGMQAESQSQDVAKDKDSIRRAQEALASHNMYDAKVDGIMGPKTEKAISQFQSENNLPQTGQLDQQTMAALENRGSSGAGTSPGTGTGAGVDTGVNSGGTSGAGSSDSSSVPSSPSDQQSAPDSQNSDNGTSGGSSSGKQ